MQSMHSMAAPLPGRLMLSRCRALKTSVRCCTLVFCCALFLQYAFMAIFAGLVYFQ